MRTITASASGPFDDNIDIKVNGISMEAHLLNNQVNALLDKAERDGKVKSGPFGEVIFTDKQS
jgi:hypothetical protein